MKNKNQSAKISKTNFLFTCASLLIIPWAIIPSYSVELDDGRIVNKTGNITYLPTPPSSVELFMLDSDTDLFVFTEQRGLVLKQDVAVNISKPGDYFPADTPDSLRTWENLNPGTIPKGTKVDCYYFHFDNKTYTDTLNTYNYFHCIGQKKVSGTITFKNPVLGMVIKGYNLNITNPILGIDTVEYDTDLTRSFPGINIVDGCHSDHFIMSEDRRTLILTDFTDVHHDNYRVIVQSDIETKTITPSRMTCQGTRGNQAIFFSLSGKTIVKNTPAKNLLKSNSVYLVKYENSINLQKVIVQQP